MTDYFNKLVVRDPFPYKLVNNVININDLKSEPDAVGVISNYKDHTDPKYIGPGTWNIMHKQSYKADSHDKQIIFIKLMKDICNDFPCTVCKGHCVEYIKNHPMEEYLDVLVEINGKKLVLGMFVWTWKFHNNVNYRIKKPLMSWDTAYDLYSSGESLVCSKNCTDAGEDLTTVSNSHKQFQQSDLLMSQFNNKSSRNSSQPFRLLTTHKLQNQNIK